MNIQMKQTWPTIGMLAEQSSFFIRFAQCRISGSLIGINMPTWLQPNSKPLV